MLYIYKTLFVARVIVPSRSSLLQGCSKCELGTICIWVGPCRNFHFRPSLGLLNWSLVVTARIRVPNKGPGPADEHKGLEGLIYGLLSLWTSLHLCSSAVSAAFSLCFFSYILSHPLSWLSFPLVEFLESSSVREKVFVPYDHALNAEAIGGSEALEWTWIALWDGKDFLVGNSVIQLYHPHFGLWSMKQYLWLTSDFLILFLNVVLYCKNNRNQKVFDLFCHRILR